MTLQERLRFVERKQGGTRIQDHNRLICEAADALDARDARIAELEGVLSLAIAFDGGCEVRVERARQMQGPALWAVRCFGDCLNKSGGWEFEPMPSSRDDEFLARCRFASMPEAMQALTESRARDALKESK